MANKRAAARSTPNGGSKSDYIRAHADLAVRDLVAQAKREGIKLSPAFVHTVRSATRRRSSSGLAERAMSREIRRTGHRPPPSSTSRDAKLVQLRGLVFEVGYDAADEILAGVRAELGLGPGRR